MQMRNFHKSTVRFNPIDPLDNGLREEIACEQCEPEAINLHIEPDENTLTTFWTEVTTDLKKDANWFDFAKG